MFEPYDTTQRHLFTIPSITNFVSFFIDLAIWMVISVILVYSGKFLLAKRMHTSSSKSATRNT
jgi:hypothetical protein